MVYKFVPICICLIPVYCKLVSNLFFYLIRKILEVLAKVLRWTGPLGRANPVPIVWKTHVDFLRFSLSFLTFLLTTDFWHGFTPVDSTGKPGPVKAQALHESTVRTSQCGHLFFPRHGSGQAPSLLPGSRPWITSAIELIRKKPTTDFRHALRSLYSSFHDKTGSLVSLLVIPREVSNLI